MPMPYRQGLRSNVGTLFFVIEASVGTLKQVLAHPGVGTPKVVLAQCWHSVGTPTSGVGTLDRD